VEVGTANFIDPAVSVKIAQGISNWLDAHNYKSVQEIIGAVGV
jgi:dihydroorotate dehydrogenase (NAD+) catalytic subunit